MGYIMKHQNLGLVLYLSTSFLLLFTAFHTAQNLTTKVLKDNHFGQLGFYALGVLYGSFGISSFFSAPLVHYLGHKKSLILGSLCYAIYIAGFILPLERSQHPE